MDVFLLGAGLPARGRKPSALKHIALNTKAMDWQIHSFMSIASLDDIYFLGGYQIADVVENYPQLNFTVVSDWENNSVLNTLLKAPFTSHPVVISYSDTIFRNEILEAIVLIDADVVFGIDTHWKERYEQRQADDINSAETLEINDLNGKIHTVEFTGLVYFGKKAIQHLKTMDHLKIGSTIVDLLNHLKDSDLSIEWFDVAGDWAEFNSPKDIANFILGTKADTLARLEPVVKKSHIGKQISFTTAQWKADPDAILENVSQNFSDAVLVVRSSSKAEDNWLSSNAGAFQSLLNIDGSSRNDISNAIKTVIKSYGDNHDSDDQILIQEHLRSILMAG